MWSCSTRTTRRELVHCKLFRVVSIQCFFSARELHTRAEGLDALLDSPLGRRVAATPEEDLASLLLNDAYKPKMHRLYAMFYGGVTADFVLNVRRTPFPLERVRAEVRCLQVKVLKC